MKKYFYLLAIITLAFTSCNEIDDVNEEIDALVRAETVNDGDVDDVVLTLTEDDYTSIGLSNFYFETEDEAKTKLPAFLTEMFPRLGVDFDIDGNIVSASSAIVTYNLFDPESEIAKKEYTLTPADYTNLGLDALNGNDEINDFFDAKFPNEIRGTVYDLTYLTDPVVIEYELTDDDYDLVGNGRFNNFDIRTGRNEEPIEVRRSKIQTILFNNFPDVDFGTKYRVTYKAFNNSFQTVELELLVQLEENPTDPARTTTYTLNDDDFDSVGNGRFNNFDIRAGGPEEDIEVRRGKIQTILLNRFPNAVSGDFFVVSYATFAGGNDRPVLTMILQFDGTDYNIFDVKIYAIYTFTPEETTNTFVFIDEWNPPITFTPEEYDLLGGSSRFENFSGSLDETNRKIAIYLQNTLFPFAAAGDFKAVQYDFFSGSVNTINVNFTYNGSEWMVISESSPIVLQFGHNGTTWIPDNTIKYTLTQADYDLVGNGRFANFDIRAGGDEEPIPARLAKINTILKNNFPNAEQGQKYSVTYAFFDGTRGTLILNVILVGSDYVLQ